MPAILGRKTFIADSSYKPNWNKSSGPSVLYLLVRHAFRRGLGTRLRMENVQRILRHANISTTAGFQVSPNDAKMKTGLKRLPETVRKKYGIKA